MKYTHARLLLALVAMVALPVSAQNLAVVNGKAIPSSRADMLVKQAATQGQQDSPELRKMIKEQLIERELLVQEAEKQGLAKSPEFKDQYEIARQQILIRSLLADFQKKNPVTDDKVKAEYETVKAANSGNKEYSARHILVEKEEQAKAILAKLKAGSKFEDLAKESKDPGSAANGGMLDWSPATAYVKEFGEALAALQKGKVTEAPVKTQFGYHVIRLEDVRDAKLPPLEEVKAQITQNLQQKKLAEFLDGLKKKAKVQ